MKILLLILLLVGDSSLHSIAEEPETKQPGTLADMIQELGDTADSLNLIYALIVDAEESVAKNDVGGTDYNIAMNDLNYLLSEFEKQFSHYNDVLKLKSKTFEKYGVIFSKVSDWLPKLNLDVQARSLLCMDSTVYFNLHSGVLLPEQPDLAGVEGTDDIIRIELEKRAIEFVSGNSGQETEYGFAEVGVGFGKFSKGQPLYEPGYRTLKSTHLRRFAMKPKLEVVTNNLASSGMVIYCKSKRSESLIMFDDVRGQDKFLLLRWRRLESKL